MSNPNKLYLVAVFLTLVLAGAHAQNKAPDLSVQDDRVVNLRDTPKSTEDRLQGAKRSGQNRLRCWQYGRLIYETRNITAMPRSERVIELRTAGDRPQTTQLMDMNNGFCILETASR